MAGRADQRDRMKRCSRSGHGRLELTKFRNPKLVEIEPALAPPNTLGLRSVMFTVESVDDTVARLPPHGAELIGEVAQYEDKYRLCYMRGPAGIIVDDGSAREEGLMPRPGKSPAVTHFVVLLWPSADRICDRELHTGLLPLCGPVSNLLLSVTQ